MQQNNNIFPFNNKMTRIVPEIVLSEPKSKTTIPVFVLILADFQSLV